MSDPVTNVEIEDVLSSIRRLVSDGDKARTRDPAPVEAAVEPAPESPEVAANAAESMPDKFVLTPALMVVDNNAAVEDVTDVEKGNQDGAQQVDETDEWVEEISDSAEPKTEAEVNEDPLPLNDMVWGSVDEARKAGLAAIPADSASDETVPRTLDRSELVATIAELEAAVSADTDGFEPDGSEDTGDMMGETIAWPGAVGRDLEAAQDAEVTPEPAPEFNPDLEANDAQVAFEHRTEEESEQSSLETDEAPDDYGDDDLDGLLEAGGVSLDEEALRALVSEVVREELTGPLGERITRNVRKLVRREIYRILSSQEFD